MGWGPRLILLLCATLTACSPEAPQPVPYGPEVTMVPIGGDDPRCPAYRMSSPNRMVVQALFYLKADGTFTMAQAEACPGR